MSFRTSLAVASFSLISSLSLAAFAEEPPPPPVESAERSATPDRSGFTIGFAVGAGQLELGDAPIDMETATSLSLRLGYAVSPHVLIQLDGEAARASSLGSTVTLQMNFYGASVTTFVHDRIYLLAGAGVAHVLAVGSGGADDKRTSNEPAVLLGAGFELYQSDGFGLDLEAKVMAADIEDETVSATSVMLGFQWW
jgi:hypothetical protein